MLYIRNPPFHINNPRTTEISAISSCEYPSISCINAFLSILIVPSYALSALIEAVALELCITGHIDAEAFERPFIDLRENDC